MPRPIVCGIDFSEHSRRALAWARFLADRSGAPLVIVHAVEPVLAEAAKVTYGPDALRASIDPDLRTFAGPMAPEGTRWHVGVGQPWQVLHGAALAHDAALMVVGTQGLGRAARVWFGSTTMRLLREAAVPVLCIPPKAPDMPRLTALVVGTDFSEASTAAVSTAVALGAAWSLPVTCVHVVPAVAAHARWNDVVRDAEAEAVRAARARMADSADVTTDVRTGDAAEVMIQAGAGGDVLLVVGLGGADTGQRPGTTAYRLASGAEAPVLGVPRPRA